MSTDETQKAQPGNATRVIETICQPLRLAALRYIVESPEPISPSEVARGMCENASLVAYHIRVLAKHRVVKLARTEPSRGSKKHFYAPNPEVVGSSIVREILATDSIE
jgi:predicted transcriptional regulator